MRERDEKNAHKIRETYLMNSRVKNTKHKCLRSVDEIKQGTKVPNLF